MILARFLIYRGITSSIPFLARFALSKSISGAIFNLGFIRILRDFGLLSLSIMTGTRYPLISTVCFPSSLTLNRSSLMNVLLMLMLRKLVSLIWIFGINFPLIFFGVLIYLVKNGFDISFIPSNVLTFGQEYLKYYIDFFNQNLQILVKMTQFNFTDWMIKLLYSPFVWGYNNFLGGLNLLWKPFGYLALYWGWTTPESFPSLIQASLAFFEWLGFHSLLEPFIRFISYLGSLLPAFPGTSPNFIYWIFIPLIKAGCSVGIKILTLPYTIVLGIKSYLWSGLMIMIIRPVSLLYDFIMMSYFGRIR